MQQNNRARDDDRRSGYNANLSCLVRSCKAGTAARISSWEPNSCAMTSHTSSNCSPRLRLRPSFNVSGAAIEERKETRC
jgi:hypothetical protein